jgi:hypothetical protein
LVGVVGCILLIPSITSKEFIGRAIRAPRDGARPAGALPFLEHALFKLWEKRDGRRLTAKAYTETGRLQGALDAHAEDRVLRAIVARARAGATVVVVGHREPVVTIGDQVLEVVSDGLVRYAPV